MKKTVSPLVPIILGVAVTCSLPAQETRPELAQKVEGLAAAEAASSPMLVESLKHVDFGGSFFAFMNVEGDLESLAESMQGIWEGMRQSIGDDTPDLDFYRLLELSGMDRVRSVAASSIPNGELFRNRAYIDLGGEREGMLRMLGGDPGKPLAMSVADADADVVYERDFDLSVLNGILAEAGAVFGEETGAKIGAMMSQETPLGMTPGEILRRSKGRLLVFARIGGGGQGGGDDWLQLPNAPNVTVPPFDLVVVMEGMDWFFGPFVSTLPPQTQQVIKGAPGSRELRLPPVGPGAYERIQPALFEDSANQRMVFTTSPAYWEQCRGDGEKLGTSNEFKAAYEGLPELNNGLLYISGQAKIQMAGMMQSLTRSAVKDGGMPQGMADILMGMVRGNTTAEASVQVNLPNGILMASNGSASMKESLMLAPAAGMVVIFGSLGMVSYKSAATIESPAKGPKFDIDAAQREQEEMLDRLEAEEAARRKALEEKRAKEAQPK